VTVLPVTAFQVVVFVVGRAVADRMFYGMKTNEEGIRKEK